jgi:hypothetical protein
MGIFDICYFLKTFYGLVPYQQMLLFPEWNVLSIYHADCLPMIFPWPVLSGF